MGNYLFYARSTARKNDKESGISKGDPIEIPIIVHELYSRPHNVKAVPDIYKASEIREAVENIEEDLGYELEMPSKISKIKKKPEKFREMAQYAKQAGFDPFGNFMAQ